MSFAEKDYTHGVDLVTFEGRKTSVNQLVYTPQHRLRILPDGDEELSPKKLEKLIETELQDRTDGKLDEHFDYVVLKVKMDSVSNDEISTLEELVNQKNAVLCKIQKVMPLSDLPTTADNTQLQSIDDILNRDPMDTLREAFYIIFTFFNIDDVDTFFIKYIIIFTTGTVINEFIRFNWCIITYCL